MRCRLDPADAERHAREAVLDGRPVVATAVVAALLDQLAEARATSQRAAPHRVSSLGKPLTDRQLEILALAADGASYTEVGHWLSLSAHTVSGQLHLCRRKLGASTTVGPRSAPVTLGCCRVMWGRCCPVGARTGGARTLAGCMTCVSRPGRGSSSALWTIAGAGGRREAPRRAPTPRRRWSCAPGHGEAVRLRCAPGGARPPRPGGDPVIARRPASSGGRCCARRPSPSGTCTPGTGSAAALLLIAAPLLAVWEAAAADDPPGEVHRGNRDAELVEQATGGRCAGRWAAAVIG